MFKNQILGLVVSMMVFSSCGSTQILESINEVLGGGDTPVTETEIGQGLREALTIGISKGADAVSVKDGYFKNPTIKIPWPEDVKKVEKTMRDLGLGNMVDKSILSINRAAEDAAQKAKPIFIGAIKQLTFQDVMNILKGEENAATQFLERTTSNRLRAEFKPSIQNSLEKVNATKYWDDVITRYNKIPFVNKVDPDLSNYVTQKAMDGLFLMVAKEEKKIRKDPLARTTNLLKRVFSLQD